MRAIDNKYLCKLLEVFETEKTIYMVMNICEGGSLRHRIKSKEYFSKSEQKNILFCLVSAVHHLHLNEIMHRDIKLENILFFKITNKREVCLVDFGLATYTNVDKLMFVRCGTAGYVAPEIIKHNNKNMIYSKVCDIFSIGIVFHIL